MDEKQSMSQHVKKIKSNNKYKQYKPRECVYTKSKSKTNTYIESKKDNKSQYSRQSSSIWSLSETPQPKEFRIGADHQMQEPEYHRIHSNSRHHYQYHHKYHHQQNIEYSFRELVRMI